MGIPNTYSIARAQLDLGYSPSPSSHQLAQTTAFLQNQLREAEPNTKSAKWLRERQWHFVAFLLDTTEKGTNSIDQSSQVSARYFCSNHLFLPHPFFPIFSVSIGSLAIAAVHWWWAAFGFLLCCPSPQFLFGHISLMIGANKRRKEEEGRAEIC